MTNPKLTEIFYEAIEQWSCESDTKTEAIFKETIQQAYELGREDENEECAEVVEGGRFLHEDAPDARLARECAKAIRSRRKGTGEVVA